MTDDETDLDLAHRLADVADAITGRFVGRGQDARRKVDGSPVTDVDVAVERALWEVVDRERPSDGYLGEEVGARREGRRRWIVDGIDGTAAFVEGRPEWATLIGLESDGAQIVGVASSPALGRRWWANRGAGSWTATLPIDSDGAHSRLQVSDARDLATARVETWVPTYRDSSDRRRLADQLRHVTRSGGDLPWATPRPADQRPSWDSGHPGGALLVAAGLLDGFVMLGAGAWDLAATAVLLTEAGGRYSDLSGRPSISTEVAVFTNGRIHEALLGALNRPLEPS